MTVSLAVLAFTVRQVAQERDTLTADLQQRTRLLADSLRDSVESYYANNSTAALQKVVERFANRQRLAGLVIYDYKGDVVAASGGLPDAVIKNQAVVTDAMDSDKPKNNFVEQDGKRMYLQAEPLHRDNRVVGAFAVVQNASYIDSSLKQIWHNNFLRLLWQTLLFSLAAVLLLRWLIFKPLFNLVESVRQVRAGGTEQEQGEIGKHGFFRPLAREIFKMSTSLRQARSAASEEARLRFQKLETPWTAERLKEFIKAYLKDKDIFVVSNREPYSHLKVKNRIDYQMPASGMVTAIEPVMEACGGMWLAVGSGEADRETVDAHDKIAVPPEEPKYTLKRIWLTEQEQKGFYVGFSNEALWPLCHMAHTRPIFRKEDWEEYRRVNGKFAQSLLEEIKKIEQPFILVQDFHFALLPALIKKSRPDARLGLFWHIPWPNEEFFRICPWRKEILEGMLGADVIGFHTQHYCNNFLDTVAREIESLVDLEQFSITHKGHLSHVKPFPISIPFTSEQGYPKEKSSLLEDLAIKTKYLGLGVDRLDYTKGILERFKGLEVFFETYPAFQGEFTFLQIASPSREEVAKYRQFNQEVTDEAERINKKFERDGWRPIVLLKEYHTHQEIYQLYRQANVCLVTPLHDGMNLVAKEFIAARHDENGVLVLSQFAGAARDLKEAVIINPYSAVQIAEAIHAALAMPATEQYRRMKKMRETVKNYNVYRWSAELIKAVASLT